MGSNLKGKFSPIYFYIATRPVFKFKINHDNDIIVKHILNNLLAK